MGAIERLAAIWKANLNEVLDRIEDPAKMVDQIVRDAERAVDQAVDSLVKARATKRRLERDSSAMQSRCRCGKRRPQPQWRPETTRARGSP